MPQLPPDFEEMDDENKELALHNKDKATWTKACEIASLLNNRTAWKAMQELPVLFKEMFRRCDGAWDEGVLPLRQALIEIRVWGFGAEEDLSIGFTEEQIAQYTTEFGAYQEWCELRRFVKEMLEEGWIAAEQDLDEVRVRNKILFDYYVSKLGPNRTPDEVRSMWPFTLDM
ncbi:hypothetical protein NUU61_008795 [Penicillium alfredii]|uniref:Uncharacterized protein n=1 Tax=Penicillium alfredii TaxID=1506179 RepID=A0A9W9ELX1_9EURO|nr:uncharacterized protein NUU61_008795 [Penicillium alfredii]KAJ5084216.1 hypothetical protein NUU61_008795 [Penicillium alfredii]